MNIHITQSIHLAPNNNYNNNYNYNNDDDDEIPTPTLDGNSGVRTSLRAAKQFGLFT